MANVIGLVEEDGDSQNTPETSMEDTIAATWKDLTTDKSDVVEDTQEKAVDRARQPDGKFAPKEAVVEDAQEPAQEGVAEVVEEVVPPVVEAVRPPSSWTAEAKAEFSKSSPVIQQEVLKREADFHAGLENYKAYAQKGQSYEQAVAPFMATIQSLGATPEQAIKSLLGVDHQLRYGSAQQKTQGILSIMRDYGIDINAVVQHYSDSPQQPQVDPAIAALQQRISQFETQQENASKIQAERERATLNSEIVEFSKGKEHFAAVRDDMAALLQTGRATTLADAYDKAIRINPVIFEAEQAKQRAQEKAEQTRKANDARRAAAVNIPSRGIISPKAAVGTFDETIRAEAERLGLI